MNKLNIIDGALSINDGAVILSRWVVTNLHGMIVIRNAFGDEMLRQKVNSENPIETDTGEKTTATDVLVDVGSSWKSSGFPDYYQWVMTGKTNEIVSDGAGGWEFDSYGIGDVPLGIKSTQIATLDGDVYLESVYNLTLRGITVEEFVGTSTPTIDGFKITFTAGTALYMRLSNGAEYWFQASNGLKVYDLNGITVDFIVVQDVVGAAPVQVGSDWGFPALLGNDLLVKDVQVGKFDGLGSYVNSGIDLSNKTKATIAFMAKVDTGGRTDVQQDTPTSNRFGLQFIDGFGLFFVVSAGASNNYVRVEIAKEAINNKMVVAVFDGTLTGNENRAKIFIDGVQQATTSINTIPASTGSYDGNLNVGKGSVLSESIIINACAWDKALTQTEINNLSTVTEPANLLFCYNFRTGGGTQIFDNSVNGNDGTLIGANLVDFWGTKLSGITDAFIKYGGKIYGETGDLTNKSKWRYVVAQENGTYLTPTITGYQVIATIPPGVISDSGNTFDGLQVAGLETGATYDDINTLSGVYYDIIKTDKFISRIKINE